MNKYTYTYLFHTCDIEEPFCCIHIIHIYICVHIVNQVNMFLFRNKHVYNCIYKYIHAYMRIYPYSQKRRIKIKS